MYFYQNPSPRALVGGVIVKDIRQVTARTYTCMAAGVHNATNRVAFGAGEIQLLSDSRLLLRTFPIPEIELTQTVEEFFTKVTLDDEEWFQASLRSSGAIPRPSAQAAAPTSRPGSPKPQAPAPAAGTRGERRVALTLQRRLLLTS